MISMIQMAVAPVLVFILVNAVTVRIMKCKFGSGISLTIMISTLLLIISQLLFSTFRWGLGIVIGLSLLGLLIIVFKHKEKDYIDKLISDGLFVFLLMYFLLLFINADGFFTEWDEWSHWGKMVKEMLRLDKFYCVNESQLLVHKDYPPFVATYQYLWCRLAGRYGEGIMIMSVQFLELGLLLPLLADRILNNAISAIKRIVNSIILIGIGVTIIIFFDAEHLFSTIYVDYILASMFALIIIVIYDSSLRNTAYGYSIILVGCFSLMLVKQMSIPLFLLIIIFYVMIEFKKSIIFYCRSAVLVMSGIISYCIWNKYIDKFTCDRQFNLRVINIDELINVLLFRGEYIKIDTYKKFVNALFCRVITNSVIKCSFVALCIVFIIGLFLLIGYEKDFIYKREAIALNVVYVLGSVGYAFTMMILYLYCYGINEMTNLYSFERYMDTLVIAWALIIFYVLVLMWRNKNEYCIGKYSIGILIVLILMLDNRGLTCLIPAIFKDGEDNNYVSRAEYIQNSTEAGSSIFVVGSNNCMDTYYINYYLDNRIVDIEYLYSDFSTPNIDENLFCEGIIKKIQDVDYVYIYDVPDNIEDVLGEYTETKTLESNMLYSFDGKELKAIKEYKNDI